MTMVLDSARYLNSKSTKQSAMAATALFSVIACSIVGFYNAADSAWGLLPILIYAVFCIWGLDIVLATALALLSAFVILQSSPVEVGGFLGAALSNNVTIIGLVSLMGAGLGEVLKNTGVAHNLVSTILNSVGIKSKRTAIVGMMLASMWIVAMLGTIGGSLAIAAPILIAFATEYKITRRATAVIFLYGGCAGLALAPFAGSNIAIMQAAEVSYLQYLTYGAVPLAIMSMIVGIPVICYLQKRAAKVGDYYPELKAIDSVSDNMHVKRATKVFIGGLLLTVVYACYTRAGVTLPLLALPVIALCTGYSAGKSLAEIMQIFYRGAGSIIHLFILFWLLATLFGVVDKMGPFENLVAGYRNDLIGFSPYGFVLLVALIGLIGIPGASAAVVVLVDQIFGGLADQMGISAAAWIIVLIFSSKGDTYGPFPNPNMLTCMGMARYENLRYVLLSGWVLLLPCTLMYAILLIFV